MLKLFTSSSKLIIIYILTVLVSGTILVFLSVRNISNFEELTEKKITEEERSITELFAVAFQKELEKLGSELENNIKNNSIQPIEGVKNHIIIDSNATFIKPHFVQTTFQINIEKKPNKFKEKLKIAEHYEFVLNDYKSAENNYLRSLSGAKNHSDSATVYNAIARLCIKQEDKKRAFEYYRLIINNFKSSISDYGFPYAYFSMKQLLQLNNSMNYAETRDLIILFLNNLINGEIPLIESTSNLLKEISNWAEQSKKDEKILEIERLTELVVGQLTDVKNYGETMKEMKDDVENVDHSGRIGEMYVLKPKDNAEELMLLHKNVSSIGFIIILDDLFSKVIENPSFKQTKFDYNIKTVRKKDSNHLQNNELTTITEFSPYFNNSMIHVSLKDRHIVEETVFRRKLSAGIGVFLLISAMILGLFLLIRDVNRNKRMERMRADFVSNVTHELKTPLTSINMFADSILLDRVKSKKDLKKYAHIIVKESEKLKRMINNILDFSRKENDKLIYNLKEYDLLDIVNATMEEMNYWLEINKFEVILDLQENVRAAVDPEGIKQVLSNLISNAIKYSPKDKKLIVRLFKKGEKAFIEVEDFGIGIPEEKLHLIFEKFYRVNSKKNETVSGTGLGLTVSKDIIEAQNGKLLVESTLNKGSKFIIVLKL
ncbi:MAG: tetratricopeptide repeat-containing sensor histidine kinase [Bacteroidota bacterium]